MLHFQTPDGKMAFKNNTVEFFPVKIGQKKKVKPHIVKNSPVIDGDISDVKWKKNVILDQFNDVQGDPPIHKTEIVVSMNKERSRLYIAGKS